VNITGFSAKLLVRKIANEFGGRNLTRELFPFASSKSSTRTRLFPYVNSEAGIAWIKPKTEKTSQRRFILYIKDFLESRD